MRATIFHRFYHEWAAVYHGRRLSGSGYGVYVDLAPFSTLPFTALHFDAHTTLAVIYFAGTDVSCMFKLLHRCEEVCSAALPPVCREIGYTKAVEYLLIKVERQPLTGRTTQVNRKMLVRKLAVL